MSYGYGSSRLASWAAGRDAPGHRVPRASSPVSSHLGLPSWLLERYALGSRRRGEKDPTVVSGWCVVCDELLGGEGALR